MIDKLVILAVVVLATQGDVVDSRVSRQGNLNTYVLYTRAYDNARTPVDLPTFRQLDATPEMAIAELNSTLNTVVIVHDHGGDKSSTLISVLIDAFFNENVRSDAQLNVIVIDWSDYTKQSYSVASAAVPSVGKALGDYLELLLDEERFEADQLHLIGFGLGAHVVGFAGRGLGGRAARITGLDPSGNGWGSSSPRLSKTDAAYVEVIHTDGNGLQANGIGVAIGDVDFFVNGGGSQPGCITNSCCHNRAFELFAATLIREEPLIGNLCTSQFQLTFNLCKGLPEIAVGGDVLWKRLGTSNLYRVNTGRSYPF